MDRICRMHKPDDTTHLTKVTNAWLAVINPDPICNTQSAAVGVVSATMNARGMYVVENTGSWLVNPGLLQPAVRPSHLHLVSTSEVQALRDNLRQGILPADLELKLARLAKGGLGQVWLEQNCRRIIELVRAALANSFTGASWAECDQLLRALAYVRKDDDAIPDYRPDGFRDDHQEMNAVMAELNPLLRSFKSWRLQHQVPLMWATNTPSSN